MEPWLAVLITLLAAYGGVVLGQTLLRFGRRRELPTRPRASLLLAVRNQEAAVEGLVSELLAWQADAALEYELVAVDVGSSDSTPAILSRLADHTPGMRNAALEPPRRGEAPLSRGLLLCRHPVIICVDATAAIDVASLRATLSCLLQPHVPADRRVAGYSDSA